MQAPETLNQKLNGSGTSEQQQHESASKPPRYPGEGKPRRNGPLTWTPKQRQVWEAIRASMEDEDCLYEYFHARGAAGTGKTEAVVYFFMAWSCRYYDQDDFIISGYQFKQTMHVVGQIIEQFAKDYGLNVERNGERWIKVSGKFFGRGICNTYHTFAGHDKRGANSALGYNAVGILLDEAEKMHPEFIDNLLDRARGEGLEIRMFFTYNPGDMDSYVYETFIDCDDEMKPFVYDCHFNLHDDNTSGEAYYNRQQIRYKKNRLRRERMIEGNFTASEQAVYPFFEDHVVAQFPRRRLQARHIALDYAKAGETHGILFHEYEGGLHMAVKISVVTKDELLDIWEIIEQVHNDLVGVNARNIEQMIVDPATSREFKAAARDRWPFPIVNGHNEVWEGIDAVDILFNENKLKVHRSCEELIKQMTNYRFRYEEDVDDADGAKLKKVVIKRKDHGPDALRYYVLTHVVPQRVSYKPTFSTTPTRLERVQWQT